MPTPPTGPTLFTTDQATMTSLIADLIAQKAGQSPPKKPTWFEVWQEMMKKARTVTLNLWECVKNRRWLGSGEIGSESASDLVTLLLGDLTACGNTTAVWATEE